MHLNSIHFEWSAYMGASALSKCNYTSTCMHSLTPTKVFKEPCRTPSSMLHLSTLVPVHSGLVHISHIPISLYSKCPHLEMASCWTFWASSMLTFGILGYIPQRHHPQNHFDELSVHESTCSLGVLINWHMDLVYADLTKVNLLDSCPFVCISWKSSIVISCCPALTYLCKPSIPWKAVQF